MATESFSDVFQQTKCSKCGRVEFADEPGLLGFVNNGVCAKCIETLCEETFPLKNFISDQIMRRNNKDATDNIFAAICRYFQLYLAGASSLQAENERLREEVKALQGHIDMDRTTIPSLYDQIVSLQAENERLKKELDYQIGERNRLLDIINNNNPNPAG